jgi:tRNA (mo5U34)-methyltransferase
VGCNAGYFALQTKWRNAGRVVGIEPIDDYLRQARFCSQIWGQDIEYRQLDAHQLDQIHEPFDLVIFTGILYHLKNPLQVLEEAGRLCRDAILIETEVLAPDADNRVFARMGPRMQMKLTECRRGMMKFVERDEVNGDGSNWWIPDTECVMGMLRTAGFTHFSLPYYLGGTRLLLAASKTANSVLNLAALQ